MSLITQQSSSRRMGKAPAEHLTPLQEKESEIADLRRQLRDSQRKIDEDQIKIEKFEEVHQDHLEFIDRLQKEISLYKKYDVEREGLFEEIRAAGRRHSSVPLSASTKAESKERAKPPQVKQSGSDTLAKELEPEKVLTASSDATHNDSQMGKIKNEVAQAQVATGPPGESISSSDEEEEQKPDASVQTGFEAATSQTRGKYWPRGVL